MTYNVFGGTLNPAQSNPMLQTDNHPGTLSLNFYRQDALPDAKPTVSRTEGTLVN